MLVASEGEIWYILSPCVGIHSNFSTKVSAAKDEEMKYKPETES